MRPEPRGLPALRGRSLRWLSDEWTGTARIPRVAGGEGRTVLEQTAGRTSWGIEIDFADTGQEVTAVARLSGGPSAAVGLGSARYDAVHQPGLRAALAAGRSLGALTDSLDYLVQAGVYAGRDEA